MGTSRYCKLCSNGLRGTTNGGGGDSYGVMFSPYGFMVLKALIQTLSSSGFLDLQHILLAALSHRRGCGVSGDSVCKSSLDPVCRSSAGYLSHMATKSIE